MISATNLTKYYGDRAAIHDLCFDISQHEVVGLLGLNGAGKSTTLKILASLLVPSAGSVRINGLCVNDDAHEVRKLVGFLPETPPLYEEMTVTAFLRFVGEVRGLTRTRARARLGATLEAAQLKDVATDVIGHLSHGFRQRVGIAQAIIHDPPVLILDEPINGLDPLQIIEMRGLIQGLRTQHTIVLSSHILAEISQTCDRIIMVQDGHIAAIGSEAELADRFGSAYRLHVEIRGAPHQALAALHGLDGVSEVKVLDDLSTANPPRVATQTTHLEVSASRDTREQVSAALIAAGLGLLELRQAESGLERIFVRLSQSDRPIDPASPSVDSPAAIEVSQALRGANEPVTQETEH